MDAFDADVLIFAASDDHPSGRPVRSLFEVGDSSIGVGSVLLLPEVLASVRREGRRDQLLRLATLLGRLDLLPVDLATSEVAVELAARHRLKPVDAIHLATAVVAGADRFITNNLRDFKPATITEIDIVGPSDLV